MSSTTLCAVRPEKRACGSSTSRCAMTETASAPLVVWAAALLVQGGTRRMIIAGVLTDQCIDSAVRDACDLGYLVTVPTDACVTLSAARQESSLRNTRGYCRQRTTQQVVEEIERLTRKR